MYSLCQMYSFMVALKHFLERYNPKEFGNKIQFGKYNVKRFKQIRLISFIQTANKQKIFRIAHNMLNICKISFIICVVTLTKKDNLITEVVLKERL